jgi:DNA-binding transcriptional regulator YhcF (GntR family)
LTTPISISKTSGTPKYVQISDSIIELINNGLLAKGEKLPSINEISNENHLARETVVKAFSNLREKGLVTSIHGKGFYVSNTDTKTINRIFVLFDTFTSYKETLYYGMKKAFDKKTILDIYFHHFNFNVFRNLISSHLGAYTSYVIIPMYHKKIDEALALIPEEKLYLLDVWPQHLEREFVGIYQDFENDVWDTFSSIQHLIKKYKTLTLVFRNTITDVPKCLEKGFVDYCTAHKIKHRVNYEKVGLNIKKGEAYIVIDDEDLVRLVESAKNHDVEIGKDLGIISYNDTPLKKVVGNGISVISTDFSAMGTGIAEMIMQATHGNERNKTTFVDRGSF